MMEGSVFDVLDELEYETSVDHDAGFLDTRPGDLQSRSHEILDWRSDENQQRVRDQWPHKWESHMDGVFPLDDFGKMLQRRPYL